MANLESEAVIDRIHAYTAKKGKPGLVRMRRLLELLDHPEETLRVVHIAGTNGKGSTSQFVASMLRAGGYSVAVYTSPHVMEYNERFEVDGRLISDDDFCRLADYVMGFAEQLNDEGYGYMSEFEILTSTEFLWFSEQKPDFTVLEAGLGGRIDMTNVIEDPVVSIITQIGLDHTDMLGNTLAEIAANKAGIIKKDIPIVSESPEEEVRQVMRETATNVGTRLLDTSQYPYEIRSIGTVSTDASAGANADADADAIARTVFDVKIEDTWYRDLTITLPGEHQVRNAIAALTAVLDLRERGIVTLSDQQLNTGLLNAKNMGRFEFLSRDPYIVIDGAHNPNGVEAAMRALKDYFGEALNEKKLLIVTGCMKDKQHDTMSRILADGLREYPYCDIITTEPVTNRALNAEEYAEELRSFGMKNVVAIADEKEAYDRAVDMRYDITLFIGSIYLIGDIRIFFHTKGRN